MEKTLNYIIKIMGYLALIGTIAAIGVITYASAFSEMVSDDFWFAMDTGKYQNEWQYFVASCRHTMDMYNTWQGAFFATFINSLFNPVNRNGFATLRIFMIVNALLVYGSILFLICVILNEAVKKETAVKCLIVGCVVFAIAEYDAFAEIFFWYTGAAGYGIPFAIAILTLAVFILANQKQSKVYSVIACVLGFLASGGSLTISGTLCYLLLILILYYSISQRKVNFTNIVIFLAAFISALINTLSPGNFIRQKAEIGANISIIQALDYTRGVYFGYLKWLFGYNNFAAVLAILFICGIALANKVKVYKMAWGVASLLALVAPAVAIFPVVYGYKVEWIPNRCLFILITIIALCFGNFTVMIGTFIGKLPGSVKYVLAIMALIFSVGVSMFSDFSPKAYKTVRIVKGLYDHKYQDSYNSIKEIFESFSSHQYEDVEIVVAYKPEEIDNYYCFYLSKDADDLANEAIAWAYNLKTIRNIGKQ